MNDILLFNLEKEKRASARRSMKRPIKKKSCFIDHNDFSLTRKKSVGEKVNSTKKHIRNDTK